MTQPEIPNDFDKPDAAVGDACRTLLSSGQKITLRSVGAKIGIAHTTLARDQDRRSQIERARALQKFAEDLNGTRRGRMSQDESVELAKAKARISDLEAENALLIASHRAMIMAVGEMGGMRAWRNFFEKRSEILERLACIGALPDSVIELEKG